MEGNGDGRSISEQLRSARLAAGLSQQEVADRVSVSQPQVSLWEQGKASPSRGQLDEIRAFLSLDDEERTVSTSDPSAFGVWLEQARRRSNLTRRELWELSGVTDVQIANIEQGRTRNPREVTRKKLESALNQSVPQDVQEETQAAAEVAGLGALEDFDPNNETDWPRDPGVYVLYDISDRAVYVGKAVVIAQRLKEHRDKFWFRSPIVQSASFIRVEEGDLRHQLEQVLIKFLKSNAVINQQGVSR